MKTYHKIHTIFKRDQNNMKKVLIGEYSKDYFEYLEDAIWIFTEKVDGTNIRIIFNQGEYSVKGKTDDAQIPAKLLENINMNIEQFPSDLQEKFPYGFCLYGEGYGANIQKGGGNYRPDQGFILFDVMINGYWLSRKDMIDIANLLGIDVVPTMGYGTLKEAVKWVSNGLESSWGDFMAEGLVGKPLVQLFSKTGERIITKIKHRDFL